MQHFMPWFDLGRNTRAGFFGKAVVSTMLSALPVKVPCSPSGLARTTVIFP